MRNQPVSDFTFLPRPPPPEHNETTHAGVIENLLEIPSPRSVLAGIPLDVHHQTVVLVDPLSTGVLLQKRLFNAGTYSIVLVWSDRSQPAAREKHFMRSGYQREDFAAVIVHKEGGLEETLDSILAATAHTAIAAVLCGSEFGVLLEDQIADGLNARLGTTHLKSSGMPARTIKVDKHLQANTLRKAGLAAVRERLAHTAEDVRAFLEETANRHSSHNNNGPAAPSDSSTFSSACVVKPQTGAGSVGVTFCISEQEVWDAYHTILAGEHKAHCGDKYRHYKQAGVLLQEYLVGTEYIVNAVVRDGVVKTTAMWKYDKRPYNGAAFVCFSKELQVLSDDNCEEILAYAENVLQAFGFQNGAIHAEIMYTADRGPVLVELNCRLHGGNAAWVHPAELCMQYDQLSVLMDVYLNNGKMFSTIPSRPVKAYSYCHQVKMRTHVQGQLDSVIESQLERIQALPSYLEHCFGVKPGDWLTKTVDMPSVPGEVTLVHNDKAILAADYEQLNQILAEGIFHVV